MDSLKKLVSLQVADLIKPLDAEGSDDVVAAKPFSPAEELERCIASSKQSMATTIGLPMAYQWSLTVQLIERFGHLRTANSAIPSTAMRDSA